MEEIKKHLIDTICSVRNGSMDEKQFRATVEHNLGLMEEYAVSKERESIQANIDKVLETIDNMNTAGDFTYYKTYSDLHDAVSLINTK